MLRTGTFLVGVKQRPGCGRAGHKLIRALAVLLHDAPRQACLARELVAACAAYVIAKLPASNVNVVAAGFAIKVFFVCGRHGSVCNRITQTRMLVEHAVKVVGQLSVNLGSQSQELGGRDELVSEHADEGEQSLVGLVVAGLCVSQLHGALQ